MVLLKLLIFTLTFSEFFVDLDALSCQKGQRVTGTTCASCHENTYQPEKTSSKRCKPCTVCAQKTGSVVKEECTRERDRECQCRNGFVPWDNDSSTCKCDPGFGLVNGECNECQHGYFTTRMNSRCQKWKECAAGVRFAGSTTQDVICNEGPKSNTSATISPTSSKVASLITRLTSHHPQGGNKTQTMITTTTATTTSAPAHTPKRQSSHSSITGNHIGMAIVMFGVVVLLGLTSVMCKPHITACMEKGPAVQKNDSLCRRPVEESGDDSLSSLKLNPEEP